jgi:hypothetical protein
MILISLLQRYVFPFLVSNFKFQIVIVAPRPKLERIYPVKSLDISSYDTANVKALQLAFKKLSGPATMRNLGIYTYSNVFILLFLLFLLLLLLLLLLLFCFPPLLNFSSRIQGLAIISKSKNAN